ncbi:hypothetical protein LRH25_13925 [Ideonella azotifigens]|nr:hypothetical protein [Ideonella azotifigens]MCD2341441.1 hypothetical protein [Ideonella azotifigens]
MNRTFMRPAAIALALAASSSWVHAKVAEIEPNNRCAAAQSIGAAPGVSVSGEIIAGDVDFFRVTATPGKLLQVNLSAALGGGGTLADSIVGVFDSNCQQISQNDYAGPDMDSRALFRVPADGTVIFAAAGFPDFSFTGNPSELGTYSLKVVKPQPPYVTGTVKDAVTGLPLPVGVGPVTLRHCDGPGYDICQTELMTLPVAADGSFALSLSGIDTGYYQLSTSPTGYVTTYGTPFHYDGPDTVFKEALKAKLAPVSVTSPTNCTRATDGGDCEYTVTLTNITANTIDADVWTMVSANMSGGPYGTATFMSGTALYTPAHVQLAPGASTTVTQLLPIAGAPTGILSQGTVYVSKAGKPLATLGQLFFGFTVTPEGATGMTEAQFAQRTQGQALRMQASRQTRQSAQAAAPAPQLSFRGSLLNAETGQPVTDPAPPYVNLYLCMAPGYALCTGYLKSVQVGLDGNFSMDMRRAPAGRYQFWAMGIPGFDIGYSAAFDYDGKAAPAAVNFTVPPKHIVIANITACSNSDALPAGSKCSYGFDLRNTGTTTRTLAFWTSDNVLPTGSPNNNTSFAVPGDGGQAQTLVTLQPGETRHISKGLPQVTKLPVGAHLYPSLWLSTPDKPFEIWASDWVPTVNAVPAAGQP